jgi:hypothetical protein
MTPNGMSKSSRKMVNASSDSVMKNQVRSYKRYTPDESMILLNVTRNTHLYLRRQQRSEEYAL